MRGNTFLMTLAVIALILANGCSSTSEQGQQTEHVELTISAAASLNDALQEIKNSFEKSNENISILYNFGGSGTLQKQIEQGAPADLFISASASKFDKLDEKGLIDQKYSSVMVSNRLVLITPQGAGLEVQTLEDLTAKEISHLAIGIPESVPAGNYAREALEHAGLWGQLKDKLVLGKDVRQVLSYVETGNAEAGFVYESDASISNKVEKVLTVNEAHHSEIKYPAGVLKHAEHPDQARRFFDYLSSDEAAEIFTKYGFTANNEG
ncbi:molybdate ABC transporter substrate-binding protein [Bacillus marinisedimentorum]|uniref:molybdate ABC transporter substrate-binding protein n=1 Tax=Bacillus marinisedimentorum TaxID=1821260 RepID=UPI000872DB2B|nr:molybdate ABC transporter substrate-binding protein [Bacillus marinisedimentorum]